MRKLLLMLILSTIILVFFASVCAGGTTPKFVDDSFDVIVDRLPKNFKGNDPFHISKLLARHLKDFESTEFEKVEEYKLRMMSFANKKLTNKINFNDTLAFVVPFDKGDEITYDADSSVMHMDLRVGTADNKYTEYWMKYRHRDSHGNFHDVSPTAVVLSFKDIPVKNYIATNAFNNKILVKSSISKLIDLAIINDDDIMNYAVKLSFNIQSDKAKKLKQNGSILYVGNLIPPYYAKSAEFSNATLDQPLEVTLDIQYIAMKVTEIWIFDSISGEIYYKHKLQYPTKVDGL